MFIYVFMCLYEAKYLENYPTYRHEKKTQNFKILTERYLAEKKN